MRSITDRISCRTPAALQAAGPIGAFFQPMAAAPPGIDLLKLCVDSGFDEAMVSALQVFSAPRKAYALCTTSRPPSFCHGLTPRRCAFLTSGLAAGIRELRF